MELRRLITTAAASSLLAALMFVPSASATVESPEQAPVAAAESAPEQAGGAAPEAAGQDEELNLADTGSVNTTPYLLGGTAFLGLGAGLVMFARRRELHQI